jgi:hypothetical protein
MILVLFNKVSSAAYFCIPACDSYSGKDEKEYRKWFWKESDGYDFYGRRVIKIVWDPTHRWALELAVLEFFHY